MKGIGNSKSEGISDCEKAHESERRREGERDGDSEGVHSKLRTNCTAAVACASEYIAYPTIITRHNCGTRCK